MIWQLTDDKRWSALRQRFSWVEEMHHTPQDPEHHGEGDVGVHTEMVLNALITLPEFYSHSGNPCRRTSATICSRSTNGVGISRHKICRAVSSPRRA